MAGAGPAYGVQLGVHRTGKLKACYDDKGIGFITDDITGEDQFFHYSACTNNQPPILGTAVGFELEANLKKPGKFHAIHVAPLDAGAAYLPTMRHYGAEKFREQRWQSQQMMIAGGAPQQMGQQIAQQVAQQFAAPPGGGDWGGGWQQMERRVDPTDGKSYTKAEFKMCYGGFTEWETAGGIGGMAMPMGRGSTMGGFGGATAPAHQQVGPPAGEARSGVVKAWYPEKSMGFITDDEGFGDQFCHQSVVGAGMCLVKGMPVTYEVGPNPRKPGAMQVVKVSGPGVSQSEEGSAATAAAAAGQPYGVATSSA